jgi:hypothetical protein
LLTQAELHSTLPQTEAAVLVIDDLFIPRSSPERTSQEEGLAPAHRE